MSIAAVLTFLGGIGLFLLGMRLMTEGLTTAAGDTLRSVLEAATHSRLRALVSGVLITAIVQSSSAVIFTTIGFVNVGLLSLMQAVGVIYGANLGTTLTSWIVALVGFNVDLQALSLPAIGIGMTLSVVVRSKRIAGLGQALTGFGLFFLGVDVLRDAFAGLGDAIALGSWAGEGVLSLLLFVGLGIVMTLLVQSSSAALAIILTATAGGLIPLAAAAAMVIGANVGTTSTGVFAAIGATAPAKRAASAHVIFNAVTAVVAFTLLEPLLWVVDTVANAIGSQDQLAMSLAIFHTFVKLMGIVIMWPLTGLLVRRLGTYFRSLEEDESRPHFLDHNVQATPMLAMDALVQELQRMNALARHLASEAISAENSDNKHLESGHRALENLNLAVGEFASGIPRAGVAAAVLNGLPDAQRVGQYLVNVAEHALEMVVEHPETELPVPELVAAQDNLCARAVELLGVTQVEAPGWSADKLGDQRRNFETDYQALKVRMLLEGTAGEVPPKRMAATLERMSELHRIVDQATKAAIYLDRFIKMSRPPGVPVVQTEQTAQTVTVPAVAPAPQDQSDTSPQSP
ncbi:MAG: Na/Pi symporter [Pseudomonadota bacterium]